MSKRIFASLAVIAMVFSMAVVAQATEADWKAFNSSGTADNPVEIAKGITYYVENTNGDKEVFLTLGEKVAAGTLLVRHSQTSEVQKFDLTTGDWPFEETVAFLGQWQYQWTAAAEAPVHECDLVFLHADIVNFTSDRIGNEYTFTFSIKETWQCSICDEITNITSTSFTWVITNSQINNKEASYTAGSYTIVAMYQGSNLEYFRIKD